MKEFIGLMDSLLSLPLDSNLSEYYLDLQYTTMFIYMSNFLGSSTKNF